MAKLPPFPEIPGAKRDAMDALSIDPFAFARQKNRQEGSFTLAALTRLAAECAPQENLQEISLQWAVQGGFHPLHDSTRDLPQLQLEVRAALPLVCQRCLKPFVWQLESTSTLVLAQDDAAADEIEELLEDDSIDVIAPERSWT